MFERLSLPLHLDHYDTSPVYLTLFVILTNTIHTSLFYLKVKTLFELKCHDYCKKLEFLVSSVNSVFDSYI